MPGIWANDLENAPTNPVDFSIRLRTIKFSFKKANSSSWAFFTAALVASKVAVDLTMLFCYCCFSARFFNNLSETLTSS